MSKTTKFREFDRLRRLERRAEWLEAKDIEGLVWHHPDGRMVKIKKKDYRLKRQVRVSDLVATDNQSQVEPLKSAQSDPKRKANT